MAEITVKATQKSKKCMRKKKKKKKTIFCNVSKWMQAYLNRTLNETLYHYFIYIWKMELYLQANTMARKEGLDRIRWELNVILKNYFSKCRMQLMANARKWLESSKEPDTVFFCGHIKDNYSRWLHEDKILGSRYHGRSQWVLYSKDILP